MKHREEAYRLLSGAGLEIGALHQPARLPPGVSAEYLDAQSRADAIALFPEVDPGLFQEPDHIGDLDRGALARFPDGRFDFVIISHVIEHLSNPLLAIREVFRITRKGGRVAIGLPDKDHTFDRLRPVVTWEHLWRDFESGTATSSDEHYVEFLRSAHADIFPELSRELSVHVAHARQRREHTHAWDSAAFRDHLARALEAFGIPAHPLTEWRGDQTGLEYFGVWERR